MTKQLHFLSLTRSDSQQCLAGSRSSEPGRRKLFATLAYFTLL